MPEDFDKCRAEKGRIVTIKPNPSEYLHICYDKNGKSHRGEVKKTMTGKKRDVMMKSLSKYK